MLEIESLSIKSLAGSVHMCQIEWLEEITYPDLATFHSTLSTGLQASSFPSLLGLAENINLKKYESK